MMDQVVEGEVSVEDHSKTFQWKINDFLVQLENVNLPCQKFSMFEASEGNNWGGC